MDDKLITNNLTEIIGYDLLDLDLKDKFKLNPALEKEVNNLLGRLSASDSIVSIDDIKLSSSGEEYIAMIIYTEQREVWY